MEEVYHQSKISEIFNKNLYTFYSTEYDKIKKDIIEKIDTYLSINKIILNIIKHI